MILKKYLYIIAVFCLVTCLFYFGTIQIADSSGLKENITPFPSPDLKISPTPSSTPSPTERPISPTSIPSLTPTPEPTPMPTLSPTPKPPLEILAPASVVIFNGNLQKREIAFTFDDAGPALGNILNTLDRKGVKGTFFLIAGELRSNPQRWRRAIENGHHVLNHSVSHDTQMAYRSDNFIIREILGWEEIAREVLGDEYVERMKREFPIFRSPGGSRSPRMQQILGNLGYTVTAYWTVEDYYFSNNNPRGISIADHYVSNAKNGAIYLMHPYNHMHVEEIIRRVHNKGYEFKLLSEIIVWNGLLPEQSPTKTPSPTKIPTTSPSESPSPSPTKTPSPSLSPTLPVTPSPVVSPSPTPTLPVTPSPGVSPSPTPTLPVTPSPGVSPSPTPTLPVTPSLGVSPSPTPTLPVTPSPGVSPTEPPE